MTTPDPLDEAFSSLRATTPPPAAYAAVQKAHDAPDAARSRTWRRHPATRTLAVGSVLLAAAGTATAAVTASGPFSALESSATTDAPATRNLGVLFAALDNLPEAPDARIDRPGGTRGPVRLLEPGSSPVRGTTVMHDGISIDVALNDTQVCLAAAGPRIPVEASDAGAERSDTERALPPLTDVPRGTDPPAIACFPRSAAKDTLPSISGRHAGSVWIATVVPDGTEGLTVTADGGRTARPTVEDNVAVAAIPGAGRLDTLSWTAPDGTTVTQDLSVTPRSAAPTTRRLAPR